MLSFKDKDLNFREYIFTGATMSSAMAMTDPEAAYMLTPEGVSAVIAARPMQKRAQAGMGIPLNVVA